MAVDFDQASPLVSLTIVPIPGTLTFGDGQDDRGGGNIPVARAGISKSGSLQCTVETAGDQSQVSLSTLQSGVGAGAFVLTGDAVSSEALVDVEFSGDATQLCTITWKGTIA